MLKKLIIISILCCCASNCILAQHTIITDTIKTDSGIILKKLHTFEPLQIKFTSDKKLFFANGRCGDDCPHQCTEKFTDLVDTKNNTIRNLEIAKLQLEEDVEEEKKKEKECKQNCETDNNCAGLKGRDLSECIDKKKNCKYRCSSNATTRIQELRAEIKTIKDSLIRVNYIFREDARNLKSELAYSLKQDLDEYYEGITDDILPRYKQMLEKIGETGLELDTTASEAVLYSFRDIFNPIPDLPKPKDAGSYVYIGNDLEPHTATSIKSFFNELVEKRKNYDLSNTCYKIIPADKVAYDLEMTDTFKLKKKNGLLTVGEAYGKYIAPSYKNKLQKHHVYIADGYLKESSTYSTRNFTREIVTFSKVKIEFRYVPLVLSKYNDEEDVMGWRGYITDIDTRVKEQEKLISKTDKKIFDSVEFDCEDKEDNIKPLDLEEMTKFCCEEGIPWCCTGGGDTECDTCYIQPCDTCFLDPFADKCERLYLDKPPPVPVWGLAFGSGWLHFRSDKKFYTGLYKAGAGLTYAGIAAGSYMSFNRFKQSRDNLDLHLKSETNAERRHYYDIANAKNKEGWLYLGGTLAFWGLSTAGIYARQGIELGRWRNGFSECEDSYHKGHFPKDFIRHKIALDWDNTYLNEPIIGLSYQIIF